MDITDEVGAGLVELAIKAIKAGHEVNLVIDGFKDDQATRDVRFPDGLRKFTRLTNNAGATVVVASRRVIGYRIEKP